MRQHMKIKVVLNGIWFLKSVQLYVENGTHIQIKRDLTEVLPQSNRIM